MKEMIFNKKKDENLSLMVSSTDLRRLLNLPKMIKRNMHQDTTNKNIENLRQKGDPRSGQKEKNE